MNQFINESLVNLLLAKCKNSDLQKASIWVANLANAQKLKCDMDEVAVNAGLLNFKDFVETTDPTYFDGTEVMFSGWVAK